MSTGITDPPAVSRNGTPGPTTRTADTRPLPTRARRPGMIGAAALLIVGFALAGAVLVSSAGGKTQVLVAAGPIPAGHMLTGEDLRATGVAGDVRAIAATDLPTVIGQTAAVELVAGQLLNRDMLTDTAVPGPGQALVGLALAPGRFPADGLRPGDRVHVVAVPTASGGAEGADSPRVLAIGDVYAVRTEAASASDTLITVTVASTSAGRLSAHAAAGQVALIKVPAAPAHAASAVTGGGGS